jgi:hypothetical protein
LQELVADQAHDIELLQEQVKKLLPKPKKKPVTRRTWQKEIALLCSTGAPGSQRDAWHSRTRNNRSNAVSLLLCERGPGRKDIVPS